MNHSSAASAETQPARPSMIDALIATRAESIKNLGLTLAELLPDVEVTEEVVEEILAENEARPEASARALYMGAQARKVPMPEWVVEAEKRWTRQEAAEKEDSLRPAPRSAPAQVKSQLIIPGPAAPQDEPVVSAEEFVRMVQGFQTGKSDEASAQSQAPAEVLPPEPIPVMGLSAFEEQILSSRPLAEPKPVIPAAAPRTEAKPKPVQPPAQVPTPAISPKDVMKFDGSKSGQLIQKEVNKLLANPPEVKPKSKATSFAESVLPEWDSSKYVKAPYEAVTPKYRIDDIGGMEGVKEEIREVARAFSIPGIMAKYGASQPKGVLFHGEPGTGKTMLAHAIAHETGSELWLVDSATLYDMYQGLSEKNIKQLFDAIEKHRGKLVVFFDEFESIIGISEDTKFGGGSQNKVAGIFKNRLNTINDNKQDVLLVGATNYIDRIDESLIRSGRFDYKIKVPMPDDGAREQIIAKTIAKDVVNAARMRGEYDGLYPTNIDISAIVNATEGMSGADISEIFTRLARKKALAEGETGQPQKTTVSEILGLIQVFKTEG